MTELRALCLGTPVFADPRLAGAASPETAWRQAIGLLGPRAAAAAANGDFAVGVQEPSGRTVLAVDRFAIRSLCYRVVDGRLLFAERADELGSAAIDPQSIFDYLYFHVIPSPRTIFRDVFRLPPGCVAVFENGRLSVEPYWVPDFAPAKVQAPLAEAKAEFVRVVERSVRRQLDGSKPACFLSGGTDSSTVAGMIARVAGRAATYSIGFEAEGYDEMEYARTTARHFGTEHHEYYVTPDDLVAGMASVASAYDQPFGNSSVLPAYCCARMARDDGVTRLLAGDGGDELFGGNTRYAKQRVFAVYDAVPGAVKHTLLEPFFGLDAVARTPLLKKGSSYIEQARVPMPDRMQMYNLLQRLGLDEIFTPAMRSAADPAAPLAAQRQVWAAARNAGPLNRQLAFDWRYTLADCDLPKVVGSTALAGVAVGFPLLDAELVDFSLKLPESWKLRGLTLRWFFKEALRGFLADETLVKKKQGFGLPFGHWAVRHPALKRLASGALESLSARGIVRVPFIRTLLDEHLPAHPGYYGEMVWILTMLELWLQSHAPSFTIGR